MKNSKLIFVFVLILVLLFIGTYSFFQNFSKSDSKTLMDESMTSKVEESMESTEEMMEGDKMTNDIMAKSRYVEYDKLNFDSASNNRRVLFFYASWCPTCKPADASFTKNVTKIPEDVTLIRVNYNDTDTDQEEKDLAKKYGITYQHTFVQINSDGMEIAKWNGGQLDELLSNIK